MTNTQNNTSKTETQSAIEEKAILMIKNSEATCVVARNGSIISAESTKGIARLLELHDKEMLKDSFVADTIIGKAAAMIFSFSGVKACYGRTVSNAAIKWLRKNNIAVTYDISTEIIQNRKGDGMCPMEATVKDINRADEAISRLRRKVDELRTLAMSEKNM